MRLVYIESGKQVRVGHMVKMKDDEIAKVVYFAEPHKPQSSGKVTVRSNGSDYDQEFFVGIIGAHWIEREDQPKEPFTGYAGF